MHIDDMTRSMASKRKKEIAHCSAHKLERNSSFRLTSLSVKHVYNQVTSALICLSAALNINSRETLSPSRLTFGGRGELLELISLDAGHVLPGGLTIRAEQETLYSRLKDHTKEFIKMSFILIDFRQSCERWMKGNFSSFFSPLLRPPRTQWRRSAMLRRERELHAGTWKWRDDRESQRREALQRSEGETSTLWRYLKKQ